MQCPLWVVKPVATCWTFPMRSFLSMLLYHKIYDNTVSLPTLPVFEQKMKLVSEARSFKGPVARWTYTKYDINKLP